MKTLSVFIVAACVLSNLTGCMMTADKYTTLKTVRAYVPDEHTDSVLMKLRHASNDHVRFNKQWEACGAVVALGGFIPIPLLLPCRTYSEVRFENGTPVTLTQVALEEQDNYVCGFPIPFPVVVTTSLCERSTQ